MIKVILHGGPKDLSETWLTESVPLLEEKLKIQFGAGYEHFVNHGEERAHEGTAIPVLTWVGRTKIAE
ncbi:DUF5988 family protein [Streptomyces sp900105245]|uniref:DUF5988 family protein n=1 Tax=Streptomyces sp. 900105245 TaxID=3154379 RepID=A0ABV1UMU8_9ACTN